MTIYKANIISPRSKFELQIYENGALCVEKNRIVFVGNFIDALEFFPNSTVIDYGDNLLMPGMIDLHTHLPQYELTAIGEDELLIWLENYIFPIEAKFIDNNYAEKRSKVFFNDLARYGTTTALVYSSSFYEATDIAFQFAKNSGLRVYMGNTMMDCNAPTGLIHSTKDNIRYSEKLSLVWHEQNGGLLNFILTPRFAGSCSPELLKKTVELANSNNFLIQTHLSENKNEIKWIQEIFQTQDSYTRLYESFGLLKTNTILAHSIYLDEDEIELIHHYKCSIAHCPCSNRFLSSGIMTTKKYLNRGLKIGLGSDVAGSYNLSILHQVKESIENAKLLSIDDKFNKISIEEALYMATLGGAVSLGIEKETGSLEAGKIADFVLFNVKNPYDEYLKISDRIKKLIYSPDSYEALATYVGGKEVYRNTTAN